jgi:hypothetical protein
MASNEHAPDAINPQDPIELLEQAANVVPPDVELARTAMGGVLALLSGDQQGDCHVFAQRVVGLTNKISEGVLANEDPNATAIAQEFGNYAITAGILGGRPVAQTAPTQTEGKAQSGAKDDSSGLV